MCACLYTCELLVMGCARVRHLTCSVSASTHKPDDGKVDGMVGAGGVEERTIIISEAEATTVA